MSVFLLFTYFPANPEVFKNVRDMNEVENRQEEMVTSMRSDVNNENEKCLKEMLTSRFILSLTLFHLLFLIFSSLSLILAEHCVLFFFVSKQLHAEAINRRIQCYRHFYSKIQTITVPFLNIVCSFICLFFFPVFIAVCFVCASV